MADWSRTALFFILCIDVRSSNKIEGVNTMCCNSRSAHWATVVIALVAAAVPTLLYAFGIITRLFPLTLIAAALAVVAVLGLGYLAYFGKERRQCGNSTLIGECCCDRGCLCNYATELLVYAGLLFFAAFIAIAAVNTAVFGLVVALIAIVSFLSFATLLTIIRIVACGINERCDS